MKSTELKEKLEKALEKVEKIKGTIQRHTTQADKKLNELKKNGWDTEPRTHAGANGNSDAYWLACEYQGKLDDISCSQRKLAEAEKTVQNWKAKYDKQVALENQFQFEIPEAFKTLKEALVENWTKFDVDEKQYYTEKYKELGYKEFIRKYSRSRWEYLRYHNEQELRKENEKEAENWILDLYNRIKKETGEVVSWKNITVSPKGLNGYIKGKLGAVNVETILAGGYNIQRLHYRVILHKI